MLVYALGRGLVAEDECVVREIVAGVEAGRHGVADMAVAVVQSVPFRQRRNAE
jgi:tetrahydrodipicolinate N-succinyltransferase